MTGNKALLQDIKQINGGIVIFTGDKGVKITGEGNVRNESITQEKVKFVEQVEHNLLSVSQTFYKEFAMCFTRIGGLILKPRFVIPEDMILMRAPRVYDTYKMDMKTAKSYVQACLLSKDSEKDSNLWHRKLGNIHLRKISYIFKMA
jgi:hypothetical protein